MRGKHANNVTSERHDGESGHLLEIGYGWRDVRAPTRHGHIKPSCLTGGGFQGLVHGRLEELFCHRMAGQQTHGCRSRTRNQAGRIVQPSRPWRPSFLCWKSSSRRTSI